jgi:hypothetical protein
MRTSSWIVLLGAAGCSVEIDAEIASLAIVSPPPGSTIARDQLGSDGALVAPLAIEVESAGDIARVAIALDEAPLGDVVDGRLAAEVTRTGAMTLTAIAFAADGRELLSASIDVAVIEPEVADCKAWLDMYRLDYTTGPAKQGVADPVTVKMPLNGVAYRYSTNTAPRETLYGDCALMHSLAQAAPIVRAHDVTEIVDIGVYNYRCIDQSLTPPNCTLSQHAYAKAIDIAELVTGDGTRYSVLKDWVIDPSGGTCAAETEGDKDAFLHRVICELKAAGVWNIVLTPNYNGAHRNHFHVDLTSGADFIKRDASDDSLFIPLRDLH